MAVEEIILRIIGDSKSGESALERVNQRLIRFGGMLTAASDAALITFAKLGEGGAKIEALEGKFASMARAFGKSSEEMLASWEEASAGTLSRAEMMAKANQAALLGLPVDRLADLLSIARNASEATGESVAYMFDSLVTGIGRQSKMVLDNLGIVFTADEAYQSYAASIGKSADALNAQEKQAAFLEATLRAAARQQQMLGAATDNAATKIARGKAALQNAKDEIQKAFVPVAVKLYGVVESLAKVFSAIPEPIKRAAASLAGSAAGLGAIVGPVMTLKGALPLIKAALAAAGGAASSILPVIAVVLAVIGVVKLLAKVWKENWGGIQQAIQDIYITIKPILDSIVTEVRYWIGAIKQELAGIMAAVRSLVEPALKWLGDLFGSLDAKLSLVGFVRSVRDAVNVVFSTIRNLLSALRSLLEGNADEAWSPLKDAALNVMTLIVVGWRKYVSQAISFGWNLVVNLANGIINAARSVLVAAANFIGRILSRFLAPGSPPKEGPLRGIVRWGKGLMDTFLQSFKLADFGILRDALGPLRQALDSAVDLGDVSKVDALKIFGNVRQDVAALIAGFRKTGEISEEALGKISEQLGEGGKDYVEFLRRTLEHQKALDKLKKAQEAVTKAQKKGWVSKELEDQLAAAEDEAAAAEDRLNWQREYMAALQEGVDLQREMIDALKELTEALGGGGGGAADMAGAGVDMGMMEPGAPIDFGGAEEAFAGFGGFSEGFNQVKEEIRTWFEGLPGKISGWLELAKAALVTKWTETKEALKNIPVLGSIVSWLEEKLPAAIDTAKAFWDDTFKPALDSVIAFITDSLLPAFGDVADWLENALKTAIDAAKSLWEDTLKPALEIVYDFVKDDLLPMFEAISDFFDAAFTLAVTAMAGLWQNILKPALEGVWELIKDSLQPVLDTLKKFFDETLKPVLETIADVITNVLKVAWDELIQVFTDAKTNTLDKIKQVFEDIKTVVGNVTDFFKDLAEKIKGLSLPDWLTPGSPTPLEMGLRGIADAVRALSGPALSGLANQLQNALPDLSIAASLGGSLGGLSVAGAGAAAGGGGLVQNINVFVGENAMPMPNVRDGRDAESIERQMEGILRQAVQRAAVPGGVPGGG